jgi:hypothetical protein
MEPEQVVNSGNYSKVFIRNSDVISRKIAGELFLVPVKGKVADMENIFALTAVAEYIWDRLDGRKSLNEIMNNVADRFDVEQEQAESDIREFIMELMGAGLITEESI